MFRRRVLIQKMTVTLLSQPGRPSHSIQYRSSHNSHQSYADAQSSFACASYSPPVCQFFARTVESTEGDSARLCNFAHFFGTDFLVGLDTLRLEYLQVLRRVHAGDGTARPSREKPDCRRNSPWLRPYWAVSTTGMFAANRKLIKRSRRRSIWYHNAVFLAEMAFSNIGTYFERVAVNCWSMAAALSMKLFA